MAFGRRYRVVGDACMTRARLLLTAIVFALPAALLTNERFRPVDERVAISSAHPIHDFALDRAEPIYVEYGLTLRSSGERRPTATIDVNGVPVAIVPGERLYVAIGGRVLAPVTAARAGRNALGVRLQGDPGATFELRGRVQNYYGIAPDFPRVFVVADESVRQRDALEPGAVTARRWAICLVAGFAFAAALDRVVARGRRRWVVLTSPAWLLWVVLIYGMATPLHVWLSVEATGACAAVGCLLAFGLRAVTTHRRAVLKWAAVVLVNVLVLEGALRVFNAVRPSFIFYTSGYERYRGRPGAPFFDTRLNSGGFNDRAHPLVRPPNVRRRIAAIGDSFALGVVPHRDNFLTRLETELDAGGSVEVINIGIPATEPADYLAMLVGEALPYAPDLVLTCVFIGNDFETPGRRWYDRSFAATFVRALWRLRGGVPPAPAAAGGAAVEYHDDEPSLPTDRFLEIEVDRSWLYVRGGSVLPVAASRVAGELGAMRDVARRAGADFAVALIPDEVQVDERLRADVARASGHAEGDLDFEQPNRLLSDRLRADGIQVIDLLPAFAAAGRTTRLYKPQDTHWNIAGNRLAATEIAAALR